MARKASRLNLTFWLNFSMAICFIITISLGITLYVFYQKNTEAHKHLENLAETASLKGGELMVKQSELDEFKKKINGPETKASVEELVDTHNKVMEQYAKNFSKSAQTYTSVLSYLYNQALVQNATLAANQKDIQDLTEFNRNRTKYNTVALDAVKRQVQDISNDKKNYVKALTEMESSLNLQKAEMDKRLKSVGSTNSKVIAELDTKLTKATENIKEQVGQNIKIRAAMQTKAQGDVEKADGIVQFVSVAQGKAIINLGSLDGLPLRTSFTVYPRQEINMKSGTTKGSIEVVQVTGPHIAECRVLSDNPSDPILPGDKIYSPVWDAGVVEHYAIAGFINLNGDLTNDVIRLVQIIEANGGVVDGYQIGDKQVRRLESTTNVLVLGQMPDEKTPEAERLAYQNFISAAKEYRVPTIKVADLIKKMGVDATRTNAIKGGADKTPIPVNKHNFSGGSVSGIYMDEAKPQPSKSSNK